MWDERVFVVIFFLPLLAPNFLAPNVQQVLIHLWQGEVPLHRGAVYSNVTNQNKQKSN